MTPFSTIVADPPWRFDDKLPGESRGAENNYPVLSVADICNFELPPLANDCRLFLWRVASMQQEALDVMKAWGFELKTEIVWRKLTKTGLPWFGMGRTVRASHEVCLIGVRGKPDVLNRSTRSVFDAPCLRHSGKPEAFSTSSRASRQDPMSSSSPDDTGQAGSVSATNSNPEPCPHKWADIHVGGDGRRCWLRCKCGAVMTHMGYYLLFDFAK
jgi:N6-adenosine-specific RNA methylase IME4